MGPRANNPIFVLFAAKTGHFTRECKYNKRDKEMKEKGDAGKATDSAGHIFHNPSRELGSAQSAHSVANVSSSYTPFYQGFHQNYAQPAYTWQQHVFHPQYQHLTQHQANTSAPPLAAQQEHQVTNAQHQFKPENNYEHQAPNNVVHSQGHIFRHHRRV